MKKRVLCLLTCLALLMSLSVTVFAEDTTQLQQLMKQSFQEDKMLDIREYGMQLEQVQRIYDELYHSGQLPWFADADCDYVFGENDTISRFRPKELNPLLYDRDLYEQKMAQMLAETCLPGMDDWLKALSVHEYIVLHTVYDEQLRLNTGYDSLVGGSTVCYGYAMLYMDAMNRLGIPCQIVICENTGDGFGHAWNLLQLDGQWYHVDLTWDDPAPNIHGYVSHANFVKTDDQFRSGDNPHDFEWIALETAAEEPSDRFAFLDNVQSSVCFLDANRVVYRQERGEGYRIVSRDLATGEETKLYGFDRKVVNLGKGQYLYPTVGICYWNGRIYFNREDRVLSMLPDGSDVQQVYSRSADDRFILGCMANEGVLYVTLSNHDMKQMETVEVPLEGVEFHVHSYHRNTVKSTCLATGYYEQACECGVTYNRVEIPMIDHLLQTVVEQAPTQEQGGVTRHACANCDYVEYEYPPALPVPEEPVEETQNPLLQWLKSLFA